MSVRVSPIQHRFSNKALRDLIVPLFLEQLLVMLVGVADTFMVSFAGAATVSGVSLDNMFVMFFLYVFIALAWPFGGALPNGRRATSGTP